MAPLKAVRQSKDLEKEWEKDPRWRGIRREYSAEDVLRLRGSIEIKYTLAGFHALNFSMYELARQYREEGMAAYSRLQQAEFGAEKHGYTATKHQREVGTGYFDEVAKVISGGDASTIALDDSTEAAQF